MNIPAKLVQTIVLFNLFILINRLWCEFQILKTIKKLTKYARNSILTSHKLAKSGCAGIGISKIIKVTIIAKIASINASNHSVSMSITIIQYVYNFKW